MKSSIVLLTILTNLDKSILNQTKAPMPRNPLEHSNEDGPQTYSEVFPREVTIDSEIASWILEER
jgi:hypothetical protein